MRLLTYLELSRYSKRELMTLLRTMYDALPHLPNGSMAYKNVVLNIRHLRIFIARRDPALRMRM